MIIKNLPRIKFVNEKNNIILFSKCCDAFNFFFGINDARRIVRVGEEEKFDPLLKGFFQVFKIDASAGILTQIIELDRYKFSFKNSTSFRLSK